MCGFPAIAEHSLNVDPIEGKAGRWVLEKMKLIFLYTLPYVYPIGLSAQTTSVYLTLVVTIERYVQNYCNWEIESYFIELIPNILLSYEKMLYPLLIVS